MGKHSKKRFLDSIRTKLMQTIEKRKESRDINIEELGDLDLVLRKNQENVYKDSRAHKEKGDIKSIQHSFKNTSVRKETLAID